MQTLFNSIKAFLKEPFTTPFSFWQYAAIVGVTMLLVIFWTFILGEITRGVKEIA